MTLLETWDEPAPPRQAAPGPAVVRLPLLDELLLVWPHVAGLLHRATVRTGCYEPIDLLKLAMAGQVGIWVCEVDGVVEAAIVTEVKQHPRRRVLDVLFVGGNNMRAWLKPAIDTLDRHARETGCSCLTMVGRPGWARACGGRMTGDVVALRDLQG